MSKTQCQPSRERARPTEQSRPVLLEFAHAMEKVKLVVFMLLALRCWTAAGKLSLQTLIVWGWNRPNLLSVFSGRSTTINGASHGLLELGLMSGGSVLKGAQTDGLKHH